jgi:hypothetical protein
MPFFVSAQNLTIAGGANVTIGPSGELTTGEITNNAGVTGLVLESEYDATLGNRTGSLIYTNAGTEPDATVEVYVEEMGWHFVSSPVGTTIADVFMPENGDPAWIAEYDVSGGPDYPWSYITSTDAPINKGQGYSYAVNYSSKADNTVSFTGTLVSQQFSSPTLNYEDTDNTNPNNFTLLGNPFSAPINVAGFDPFETSFELTIWIWDQNLNSGLGGYQWASFYNTYPNPEMNPTSVAIGQGFFIRALEPGAAIDFDPALRAHEPGVKFFKSTKEISNGVDYLLVTVSKDGKSDNGVVSFGENGTPEFENGWDVSKMLSNNGIPEIYFELDGNRYCQNHLESLRSKNEQTVDMRFIVGETGEQTIIVNLDYLYDGYVLLEDLFADKMIDLSKNNVYTFYAEKGDNPDRFKLHFKYSVTDVEDGIANAEVSSIDVYASNKAVFVTNTDNSFEQAKIAIYDMYGRTLYSNETQLSEITRIPLNVNNSYLVVHVVKGNEAYTEKVFLK